MLSGGGGVEMTTKNKNVNSYYICVVGLRIKIISFLYLLLIFYLFIFREKGREGEREGEKHQRVVASHVTPTQEPVLPGPTTQACALCWESNW